VTVRPLLRVAALVALASGCAPAASAPEKGIGERLVVAPTAIVVDLGKEHTAIADSTSLVPERICLDLERDGSIGVDLWYDETGVTGSVALLDSRGAPLAEASLPEGERAVHLSAFLSAGQPAGCVELRLTRGSTVYHVEFERQ
jgi:hypothetical protein